MGIDRRKFLKLTGLTTLGLLTKAGWELVSGDEALASVSSTAADRDTKRWAMVIDVRKCQDAVNCTKCVDACHDLHNVPVIDDEKEEIKWIWKQSFEGTFHEQEHHYLDQDLVRKKVLVLCNHCDNPPCTRVCPTQATWRRESDGIVMMDWHRCIGCRYCVVACPYGARSFNWTDPRQYLDKINPEFPTRSKGVVEKCTFFEARLAEGKLPACVEACSEGAMTFGDLNDPHSKVREVLKGTFTIRRRPGLGTNPQIFYLV
jgi:molybdopterin-containing oxidoreductase family iron-sulfur binding subunit